MEPLNDLELLVRSRHPLIVVETHEEERLEEVLRDVARRVGVPFHVWSVTTGLRKYGADHNFYDSKDPGKALDALPTLGADGLWLFHDLHHYFDHPEIIRRLRDLCRLEGSTRRTIVIGAPDVTLPEQLEKVSVAYRLGPPSEAELRDLVQKVVHDLHRHRPVRIDVSDEEYRRLLLGLKGLTRFEAERAVTRAVLEDGALTVDDVAGIEAAKREILSQGGLLEYVPPPEDGARLGGLKALKAWLAKRTDAHTEAARAYGLPPPKGIILLGVQGCGKTHAAKMVAQSWDLPLFRLEPGRLFDKFIGESEKNLERALWLAEHLAPCVLLVDEIEKGFADTGGGTADGGLSRRIVGRLLGWLQERKTPVFVVATCNRVHDLPPELMRKGRFDEIFFVDLPDEAARREILALHLERRGRDPGSFDLEGLAAASDGFSGAELEQAIVSGLYAAFATGADLDTALLQAELQGTRPLSVTRAEELAALRAWADSRTVPAA